MATDDIQRLVTGTASAPASFTIPGSGQIRPKSVFASYDGSGAAGSYQPALKVISDGGKTVGIYSTTQTLAAGVSADVSWFPGVSDVQSLLPLPGQILSTYAGLLPAVDFVTNSNTFTPTNFPTNTTLTKVSSTSALHIVGEFDVTSGASPDTLFFSVFMDGSQYENTGIQISQAGTFATALINSVKSLGIPNDPILAAGNHTVRLEVATNAGVNFTTRTSTSVDLTIIEFEPS